MIIPVPSISMTVRNFVFAIVNIIICTNVRVVGWLAIIARERTAATVVVVVLAVTLKAAHDGLILAVVKVSDRS